MNSHVTPKKLEFEDSQVGNGHWAADDWSWWGQGWDWQDWRNDGAGWRPVRQYSWREYEEPAGQQLLARKATTVQHASDEAAGGGDGSQEQAEKADQKAKEEVDADENKEGPKQAPKQAPKQTPVQNGDGEDISWRCDKWGVPLNAKGLYQRFYRFVRSILSAIILFYLK